MRWILTLIALTCLSTAHSADLFGNEELAEGELSIAEQKDLYNQFFGQQEAEAGSSSSKQLDLAMHLRKQYDNEEFAPLRRYMLWRIQGLCEDSKKKEALELKVFAFGAIYQDKEHTRIENLKYIDLLQDFLGKADSEAQVTISEEITALLNENCAFSLQAKNYEQAEDDYKTLGSWFSKLRNKEGAAQVKSLLKHISDRAREKKKMLDLQEKADADPDDKKAQETVGRFYAKEGDWTTAARYLSKSDASVLHNICVIANNDESSPEQKAEGITAIATALQDKSTKKDAGLQRQLLQLGISWRADVNTQEDDLSPALKIKYAMASKHFDAQLEELGPDPLASFDAGGSSMASEDGLLRQGWEQIFDHKEPCILPAESKNGLVTAEVKNGTLIIKVKPGGYQYMLLKAPEHKGIKLRIKNVQPDTGITFGLVAPGQEIPSLAITRQQAVVWTAGKEQLGSQEFKNGEWNDLTIVWDGKVARASLNGKPYEQTAAFEAESISYVRFNIDTANTEREFHIQSVLRLKK